MAKKVNPSVYILHGDDEYAISRQVADLQSRMDGDWADLNTTRMDGRTTPLDAIRNAVMALPFLVERRLVILDEPLARLNSQADRSAFVQLLDDVPPTTALVLIENEPLDDEDLKQYPTQRLSDHWLIRWSRSAGERVFRKNYPLPVGAAMALWIQTQAKEAGGQFRPDAAALLSNLVGNDTRSARNEIEKLLSYVNYARPVEIEDVGLLTASIAEADIFAMVDALGERNARDALTLLNNLLETQEPLSIFGMVVRQFRLLLLAREVLDLGGGPDDVRRQLKLHNYVAKKIANQARQFYLPDLEVIYRHLLDIDKEVKTGGIDASLALNTLVAALSR